MQMEESDKPEQASGPITRKQTSVRTRAAIQIISIVLVLTAFSTAIGVYFGNRQISVTIEQDLTLVGGLTSDMIGIFITSIREPVMYVSAGMEGAYQAGGLEALGEALQGESNGGPNFISLAVAFPDNTIISRAKIITDENGAVIEDFSYALPDESKVSEYRAIAPENEIRIDTVEITKDGRHVIRCYKRIGDDAVFIATLPGEYFSQLITQSKYDLYHAGKIFLVDSGRAVIATTDESTALFKQIDVDETGNELAALVTHALSGAAGSATVIAHYNDGNGVRNICAYTPISHNPNNPEADRWVLILTVPVSETPARIMTLIFIISGLLFLAGGAAASIFLSKRQAKPYAELNRRNEELVVLREEAEKVSKAKADFLASMSHEMRTPMNAIIGMMSIGRSAQSIEKKDYAFGKIGTAAKHLLGIINDVLDISKIEANKLEISPDNFNFERTLQKITDVIVFRVEERKQQFYVSIDKKIPRMLIGDDQRLAQVITNLLSNAVKFTPVEGTIRLEANLDSEQDGLCRLRISVTDNGIGLSDEQKARLFQSYEQAEAGTSRKYGGTGLGLAISKRIVELMDGEIWVESSQGHGAKFIFTVSMRRGSSDGLPLLDEGVDWSNIRIFIVDDDKEIRDYFIDVSASLGIACEAAASGEEALRVPALEDNSDIYFIDWKLPGMNGVELARRINENKSRKSSVVIISSTDWSEIGEEARAAGVNRFLSKPLFQSNIVDVINESIGHKVLTENQEVEGSHADYSGKVLLIAEDIDINREIMLTLLEPTKITVECAEDGAEALSMFTAAPDKYDLIFMDVQMPEMDGFEATRRIRALGTPHTDIPIVAMTANVFREDVEKCMEAGMTGHIGKPIDLEALFAILKTYLG